MKISLKKGHRDFVTIATGRLNDAIVILGVLPDRKKSTVKSFLFRACLGSFRKTIKAVCSDMYDGFIHAAQEVLGKRIKIVIESLSCGEVVSQRFGYVAQARTPTFEARTLGRRI